MGRLAALLVGCIASVALAQEVPPAGIAERPSNTSLAVPNPEQERVRFFEAELHLGADGSLRVTEKFTVWVQQLQLRDGIYRDLGGQYFDPYSGLKDVEPTIQSVTVDGVSADFRTEPVSDGTRVYIGDSSADLSPGQHQLELRYETPNRVAADLPATLDWELNTGWQMPIERAQISIHLPPGVDRSTVRLKGSARSLVETPETGPLWVLADGPLLPSETLSFDLSYAPSDLPDAGSAWAARWRSLPTGHRWASTGAIALWAYFLIAWWQVGRDPRPGPKVVRFGPPEGVSPGGLRLIERQGYDPDCLVADIIALATSGHLRIERDAAGITLYRDADHLPALSALRKLKAALFNRSDSLRITRGNGDRVRASVNRHSQALLAIHERQHFSSNFGYWWPALLLAAVSLATLVLVQPSVGIAAVGGFMAVWLTGWSFGVYVLVGQSWVLWRSARSWGGHAGALFMTLFSIPFVLGEIFGMMIFAATTGVVGLAIILAILIALIGFYHWLKAPTAAGRKLLDQVAGFRIHLRELDPWTEGPTGVDQIIAHAYALGETSQLVERLRLGSVGADRSARASWFRDATDDRDWIEVVAGIGIWVNESVRETLAKRDS